MPPLPKGDGCPYEKTVHFAGADAHIGPLYGIMNFCWRVDVGIDPYKKDETMLKNLLIFQDGREIGSGTAGMGIQSLTLTQTVNAGTELTLGSVCASMLEATIYDGGTLHLAPGQGVTLYKVDDAGNRTQMGIFRLETVSRGGKNTYKILAYDWVTDLDRDITEWLNSLSGWPYSLRDLAYMTAAACGMEVAGTFPDLTVEKFTAKGLTGRHMMEWIGQVSGQFCKADAYGVLLFQWYTPAPETELTVFSQTGGEYTVAPIDNVRLALTEEDVGVCYPDTGENTYSIVGNYLLAGKSTQALRPIAQSLYDRLKTAVYTPCTIKAVTELDLKPGHIVTLGDKTVYIMSKTHSGQIETLESTGSYNRSCTTVRNDTSFRSLSGQVLEVKAQVEGLRVENRKGEDALARLEMNVSGISTQVSRQNALQENLTTQLTQLSQSATELSATVKTITQQGVSRVENEFGLTVDGSAVTIHRAGSEMENRLDETGMFVNRGQTPMLRADADGVLATDVTVRNYLVVGEHARFEDYGTGRTACFWI